MIAVDIFISEIDQQHRTTYSNNNISQRRQILSIRKVLFEYPVDCDWNR